MSNENSYSEFSFFSRFQKNGKARNKHNIRINSKDILNNLSLEISPRSFNTKKKLYSFQDYKNSLNDSSSTSDNKNSIFSTLNNRKIRLNNLSPNIFFERSNKEINSIRSAYNSPINCSLQDLIIDSKENRNLSPKINLFINENNSNNNNKESPNIISKLREFKTELFNLKQENKNLKNENEELQEILKNLKEEFKHIKDRSRNNDKIIEQEKTIKNLNSFLERQEKDFNEEKKEILNELNEQIEENKKLSEQIVKMGKRKNNYSQDFQSQLKSQEKMLKIQDEQIESLQDQIYLLTNRGGNNTIPSDPNESFDN